MLSIVADQAIPLLEDLLSPFAKLYRLDATGINPQVLKKADALLVRSVTGVDEPLLKNTCVQFVGSATTGVDHLDTAWLDCQGIHWVSSAGANAQAVTEYVLSVVAWLQENHHLPLHGLTCGVMGAGRIGRRVIACLQSLGASVLIYDPPRAEQEDDFQSIPLDELSTCDLLSIHVPLHGGDYPTFDLVSDALLQAQKPAILLNTSRGEVVDEVALKRNPQVLSCLDVWQGEPNIDQGFLQHALIATPHIAGYSRPAKWQASIIVCEQLAAFFGVEELLDVASVLESQCMRTVLDVSGCANWRQVLLAHYDPSVDTQSLKQGGDFARLRSNYSLRNELRYLSLKGLEQLPASDQVFLSQLQHEYVIAQRSLR